MEGGYLAGLQGGFLVSTTAGRAALQARTGTRLGRREDSGGPYSAGEQQPDRPADACAYDETEPSQLRLKSHQPPTWPGESLTRARRHGSERVAAGARPDSTASEIHRPPPSAPRSSPEMFPKAWKTTAVTAR